MGHPLLDPHVARASTGENPGRVGRDHPSRDQADQERDPADPFRRRGPGPISHNSPDRNPDSERLDPIDLILGAMTVRSYPSSRLKGWQWH